MAHQVHDLQQRMPRLKPASKLLLLAWVQLLLLQIQSAAGLSYCVYCLTLCISYITCHSAGAEHAAGSRLRTLSINLGDQQFNCLKRWPRQCVHNDQPGVV
jgi:hypothetical protein